MERKRIEPLHHETVEHISLVWENFDWISIKLKNRRVEVGKSKIDGHVAVYMKRLGEKTEPKIVWTCFGLTREAASALGFLLTKQTT